MKTKYIFFSLLVFLTGCGELSIDASSHQAVKRSVQEYYTKNKLEYDDIENYELFLQQIVIATLPSHFSEEDAKRESMKIENWKVLDGVEFSSLSKKYEGFKAASEELDEVLGKVQLHSMVITVAKTAMQRVSRQTEEAEQSLKESLEGDNFKIVKNAYKNCEKGKKSAIPCLKARELMQLSKDAEEAIADQQKAKMEAEKSYEEAYAKAMELEDRAEDLQSQIDGYVDLNQ